MTGTGRMLQHSKTSKLIVSSQLYEVPDENRRLTPSHSKLFYRHLTFPVSMLKLEFIDCVCKDIKHMIGWIFFGEMWY